MFALICRLILINKQAQLSWRSLINLLTCIYLQKIKLYTETENVCVIKQSVMLLLKSIRRNIYSASSNQQNQQPTCWVFKYIPLKQLMAISHVCNLNRWMSFRQTQTAPTSCCVQPRMISKHHCHRTSLPATAETGEGFIRRRFIGWLGFGRGSIEGPGGVIRQEDRDYSRCA